ncbi:MAG: OmpA family protein [Cyanobacteria bacterium J06621_11]
MYKPKNNLESMRSMLRCVLATRRRRILSVYFILGTMLLPAVSWAQTVSQSSIAQSSVSQSAFVQVTVNSGNDGPVQADLRLTLREAIEITNGTLSVSSLSEAEQQRVVSAGSASTILFDLPEDETTIELASVLPAIAQPGLTIDGTTQAGYDPTRSATAEIDIPIPVVAVRPQPNIEVFRGLTISASNVTIRGLSLYGFNAPSQITNSTPPADIFISHQPIPLRRDMTLPEVGRETAKDDAPSGVVIEQNWLGITPEETMPELPSGFGVSVFDSAGTTIQNNRIEYHNGSAIISGRQADNLEIVSNIIVSNGLSGMPDAIRLDGRVENGLISQNLMCGNDGSSVFLFKPEGSVTIVDNDIRFNGQRLRRAAIYVMGDGHRILDNQITNQKGGGVVVTAFGQGPNTQSTDNVVAGNRFHHIEGLSIDLNARRDRAAQDFQRGDGPNPKRNSRQRRQDTGNGAVNAPEFVSSEFFVIDGSVIVRGVADPSNEVELYRSVGLVSEYGPLSEPLEAVVADEDGNFEFVLDEFVGGEVLSAIATDSRYGTSEPAKNTAVRSLDGNTSGRIFAPVSMPQCTTPMPPTPPVAPDLPIIPPAIQLEVPRNIHFALDKDFVSLESAAVLDRIAAVLNEYPSIVVDLHGHTDSRASESYNQDLARRRAESARRYLLSKGIGAERMTIRSFGETELLVNETDRTNFARNRRVEFVFQDVRGVDITFVNQEEDLQIE